MNKIELLAPAGNLERLKVALTYGADAVYAGGDAFSLRVRAKNFSQSDLAQGIAYTHAQNKKFYLTANIPCAERRARHDRWQRCHCR